MTTYTIDRKAKFNYEILDEIEAGLVLTGQETKSIREGGAKLAGSFVSFREDGAYIINLHIAPYKFATLSEYSPDAPRKLLLNKKEAIYLRGKLEEKGLTIVPLSLYNRGRFIKIKLGIAKGKKKYDKRETIKKRDTAREFERIMKQKRG